MRTPEHKEGFINSLTQLVTENAALRQQLAERERESHGPTVTYWRNLSLQMQAEAKKRFDQWFVVKEQVEQLTKQLQAQREELARVTAELKRMVPWG